jgi:hypothetical protein
VGVFSQHQGDMSSTCACRGPTTYRRQSFQHGARSHRLDCHISSFKTVPFLGACSLLSYTHCRPHFKGCWCASCRYQNTLKR